MNNGKFLPIDQKYLIIGDVHGCIDELKALLLKNKIIINNDQIEIKDISIILLGDFIDKANHQKLTQTLEFLYKNRENILFIRGNHEWMVHRYLTDKNMKIDYKKDKYYNTASLLENNQNLKEKFFKIYDMSYVWLKYEYSDEFSFILTHAPCEKKYLGKEDIQSIKKMIKCESRSKNRGMPLDKLISYVHTQAEDNRHYHIFGHLSQPDIREYKNRICIDTACIYGKKLSSVLVAKDEISFDSVSFMDLQPSSKIHYDLLFNNLPR